MNRNFCLFVLCSSSLRHWCHLGFFVEETHQRSDGSCLVPSAPRRRVPRVTREDCRSCREGCSAGGVSLGNTTIVSLPSVRWHLETFRVEERPSLNPEVCQGLALKDKGANFTPRHRHDASRPPRQGKRNKDISSGCFLPDVPSRVRKGLPSPAPIS